MSRYFIKIVLLCLINATWKSKSLTRNQFGAISQSILHRFSNSIRWPILKSRITFFPSGCLPAFNYVYYDCSENWPSFISRLHRAFAICTFAFARLYSPVPGYTTPKFSCRWIHEHRTTGWSHRVIPPPSTRDSTHRLSRVHSIVNSATRLTLARWPAFAR